MDMLLLVAMKSLLVAGAALVLLRLAARRSAAERSWIAHLGLAALLLLPVAALTFPTLDVAAPEFLRAPAAEAPAPGPVEPAPAIELADRKDPAAGANFRQAASAVAPAAGQNWGVWAYAGPALVLLLLTLIALGRLFSLRARAEVLVEPHWLTALARAQHRMRFKHGTALLTSDELPSPISWGVMRPVILLNRQAAGSHAEAEAIIAHELAHVANLDWAKLLLSRIAVALFWFNPLVWLLAREAHQLREEAADDSVLAADIVDTDYAQLLVGVARHECRGLLLGAHGVAPSRNSLARRVKRVLDATSVRGPAAGPFAAGVFVGAIAFAAPLAALSFTPSEADSAAKSAAPAASATAAAPGEPYYVGSADPVETGAANPAVSTAISSAVAGTHPHPDLTAEEERELEKEIEKAIENGWSGIGPVPGTLGPKPGKVGPRFGTGKKSAIDLAVAMKAVGATPDYIRALRAASPKLAAERSDEFVALAAVGVTPAYIRDLAGAGYGNLDADDLVEAKALGINGAYIRDLASAGYRRLALDQLVELRALRVTSADIQRFRRAGYTGLSVDQLVELKAHGVEPDHVRAVEADDGS